MSGISSFADVHKLLRAYLPNHAGRKVYTLDRMTELMEALGNPQDKVRVIHVAGTSGKTSTCYYLAALLGASGKNVGLSVSPHVDEINERVQINMQPLPEATYCTEFNEFMHEVKQSGIRPTYFELLVAFAYWEFARSRIDYAVIEVGIGGLLDGTNVVARADKVCVITDIGLDHQNVLGDIITEIAAQKAGIIQLHNSVFTHRQSREVLEQIKKRGATKHADLHIIDEPDRPVAAKLPLFQRHNFNLAVETVKYILEQSDDKALSDAAVASAVKTYIPARMETVKHKDKTIILDGAHNSQKLHVLGLSISERYPGKEVAALISVVSRRGDRVNDATNELSRITRQVIVTGFGSQEDGTPHSEDLDIMAAACKTLGFWYVHEEPDPEAAFKLLLERPEPVLLVTGSFYLLNHIRPLLRQLEKV